LHHGAPASHAKFAASHTKRAALHAKAATLHAKATALHANAPALHAKAAALHGKVVIASPEALHTLLANSHRSRTCASRGITKTNGAQSGAARTEPPDVITRPPHGTGTNEQTTMSAERR